MLVTRPNISTLRRIRSLENFEDEQLDLLAPHLEIVSVSKGQRVQEIGLTGMGQLYLISGELSCTRYDGISQLIEAEDEDEDLEIVAPVKSSLYDIDAKTASTYIKIHDDLLIQFSRMQAADSKEIDLTAVTTPSNSNRLVQQLLQDLANDKIVLPGMPDVAMEIQDAFKNENLNARIIGELLESSPSIKSRVLKIANSPLYRGEAEIESIQQAVVRLGIETVRKQVLIYAAAELFHAKTSAVKSKLQNLWKRSRKVAALSRVLATRSGEFDPELAQLAGLLGDLGEVVILQYAEKHGDLIEDEKTLSQAIVDLRPHLNSLLLTHWSFGEEVITVGEESRDWFRNDYENADLCDLVLIARYHAFLAAKESSQLPLLAHLPAFDRLNLEKFSPAHSQRFLRESEPELKTIEAMIGSF